MGVYIRNMMMPNNCMECMRSGLRSAIGCTEWKYLSAGLFESRRANTCPLVEIETPHGDLIDRDDFLKRMNVAIAMMSCVMKAIGAEDDEEVQAGLEAYRDIRNGIKDCDTVIEMEDE